ncbi:MAG: isopentenyl diphosphate isomerase/L-lactate dehydrogenase-like FMN-dependent dehydrogenase [Parasphingorhabdus sp.]|jgi:isopentenyl diphosphate isomerase/L-lactate dehydrogenase-like FMN-dependent dehydrogenase
MNYDTRYPGISDLKARAKQRIPNFAFDYVDAAIDQNMGKQRNRQAFHDIQMVPRYLTDVSDVQLKTEIFGRTYDLPLGIPPVGLGNMMWPGAELALAAAAQKSNIPYVLSTFSTTDLDRIAKVAPDVAWFQLYVPQDEAVMRDIIEKVKRAGFNALVITVDIPVGAKRNQEMRNGLKLPFRVTPKMVWQALLHPTWTLATMKFGTPDFVNVNPYRIDTNQPLSEFFTQFCMKGVTTSRIEKIRQLWDGPLIIKGIQYPEDACTAANIGVDGIVVSNHGGRQLDGAPSSVDSLRSLPDNIHDQLTVMLDSGIRTGLDVIRSKALGAQMAFTGRSFYYGMGALGIPGAHQVIEIFRDEMIRTLRQLGCTEFEQMDSSWLNET